MHGNKNTRMLWLKIQIKIHPKVVSYDPKLSSLKQDRWYMNTSLQQLKVFYRVLRLPVFVYQDLQKLDVWKWPQSLVRQLLMLVVLASKQSHWRYCLTEAYTCFAFLISRPEYLPLLDRLILTLILFKALATK